MYSINRLIKENNREGQEEIFCEIIIEDEIGKYAFGHWLNQNEYAMYQEDETMIDAIMSNYLAQAKQAKIDELNYVPIEEEI